MAMKKVNLEREQERRAFLNKLQTLSNVIRRHFKGAEVQVTKETLNNVIDYILDDEDDEIEQSIKSTHYTVSFTVSDTITTVDFFELLRIYERYADDISIKPSNLKRTVIEFYLIEG